MSASKTFRAEFQKPYPDLKGPGANEALDALFEKVTKAKKQYGEPNEEDYEIANEPLWHLQGRLIISQDLTLKRVLEARIRLTIQASLTTHCLTAFPYEEALEEAENMELSGDDDTAKSVLDCYPLKFGVCPEFVLKGGQVAWAQMGDANASIPTVQPIYGRGMHGANANAAPHNSVLFVSQLSVKHGIVKRYGVTKRVEPVKGCRKVSKKDMKLNTHMPDLKVDPETYEVTDAGILLTVPPAEELPLTQSLHLF
ncbi:uncharacterized protein UHO2_06345 [Ustilago hordei]|uniref:uncharacterized protein n=1 Tax=Ustilago hordei TaxID=120017 RepID=UPI001A5F5E19|nr:uncharacterized protein UHO2_06342 [Ustilago hordei]XP_041412287.1 uncharacterized protein UHO2_06345 [Ustilago hordei]SYW80880.1 uncharacterized protein UHO2_06342 [Ustilago hordei]SYW80883.1 uncharacterized protein UHO2_06345 [Ustilago hordei]